MSRKRKSARTRAAKDASTATPADVLSRTPIVREKPLHEQHQRIGGGLTPSDVSRILAMAAAGQPERLIDLGNETRQKDGHIHGIMSTRDMAVSLYPLEHLVPDGASPKEMEAKGLCSDIVHGFRGFRGLIKHLTRSYFAGHATAVIEWETVNGRVMPVGWKPLHPRDFVFEQATGGLRYRTGPGDITGIDLLSDFPGRVVQVQRSITGDSQSREGLIQLIVWMGLFRNWSLRDWIALAEIGWKPWRLASYGKGTSDEDVNSLVAMMEAIGSTGVGVFPDNANPQVEWPRSTGGQGGGQHQDLYEALGREASKAVLGQTTSTESGPHGTRGDTSVRDQIRKDIGEDDALAVAACLHDQLFAVAVAVNLGPDVPVPATWFQTEEPGDQVAFATAVEKLASAGVRMPAKWVRDSVGCPEPDESDELVGDPLDGDAEGQDGQGEDGEKSVQGYRSKATQDGDGPEYADRINTAQKREAARQLSPFVATLTSLIDSNLATDSGDDRQRFLRLRDELVAAYADEPAPAAMAANVAAGLTAVRLAGMAAVLGEDGGLEPDDDGESPDVV